MDTTTYGYRLMELIAISGEFPTDLISRLGIGEYYKKSLIAKLKSERLIKTHYKDKLRGYRLTSGSKKLLIAHNPERFEFYLTGYSDTNQPRSDYPRRLRLHQSSQTYVLLNNAGIEVFRDKKPCIFQNTGPPATFVMPFPVFYHSREVKELGMEAVKINNSRFVGILLCKDVIYVVYYTGNTVLKWDCRTEIKVKTFIRHHISQGVVASLYKLSTPIHALIIGSDMDTAWKLMSSTGGYRKSFFMLDTSFDYIHFIPDNPIGETVLKLLCSPELSEKLKDLLASDLNPPDRSYPFEYDALKDDLPILFAYDFDMLRISRFISGLILKQMEGSMISFDFQKDSLLKYSKDSVKITTIDLNKFEGRFFH